MNDDSSGNERLLRCLWQVRAMLSDASDVIAAAVGAEGASVGSTPRPAATRGEPLPPHAALIAFPAIGGPRLPCAHTALFDTPDWRSRAQGEVAEVCLARCSGLVALSRLLGLPVSRPTLCRAGQLRPTLEALSASQHGAAFQHGRSVVSDAAGFADWFASRLCPRLGTSPMSPVRAGERALTVTLPVDLPWAAFERAFRHRTRQGSLFDWIGTAHGHAHCEMVGAEPAVARRYTLDPAGGEPMRALDLCALDAFSGVDRLIAVIETILIEHLLFGFVVDG